MLKLNAGISRKVGLPNFSSASASCHIEAELDSTLLNDVAGFQIVVQRAYQSCEQAVADQISRLTSPDQPLNEPQPVQHEVTEIRTSPAYRGAKIYHPTTTSDTKPSPRPATTSQVKAIRAICARRHIDLVSLLRDRYGLTTADELGIREASNLIDDLKSDEPTDGAANGHPHTGTLGNGAYAAGGV